MKPTLKAITWTLIMFITVILWTAIFEAIF